MTYSFDLFVCEALRKCNSPFKLFPFWGFQEVFTLCCSKSFYWRVQLELGPLFTLKSSVEVLNKWDSSHSAQNFLFVKYKICFPLVFSECQNFFKEGGGQLFPSLCYLSKPALTSPQRRGIFSVLSGLCNLISSFPVSQTLVVHCACVAVFLFLLCAACLISLWEKRL